MATSAGWQSYLFFSKESTWGDETTPAIWLPFETFDLVTRREFYSANTYTGVRQRRHPQIPLRSSITGTLAGDLYAERWPVVTPTTSIAEYLLEGATSGDASLDLHSFCFGLNDPNDDKEFAGVRINSLSINGSASVGVIKYSAALIAKTETATAAPSLTATHKHPRPFMFRDATFAIDSSAVTLESFNLTINNNLIVRYNNSDTPSIIAAGPRTIDLSFTLTKDDSTYDALRRATTVTDATFQIVLTGKHLGSGDDLTTVTIAIDKMNFAAATENMPFGDLWEQSVDYVILKPDTSDNDIDITYGTDTT